MATKKYQVFVSSTFLDLKEERQAVSRAILNLGHVPAGMELFPAADVDQLSFIKKVIDDCDYYLLIIGGRYGSVSEDGLSFTELEYQYAVDSKKPVLVFIHGDTKELKAKNVDTEPGNLEKLEAFKATVKANRLVEFWTSIENLESKALVSLTNAFNEMPQVGWRRDTGELSAEAQQRFDKLRERYDYIRDRLEHERKRAIELEAKLNGHESLVDAEVEIRFTTSESEAGVTTVGAEEIIREFASSLTVGLSLTEIKEGLLQYIYHKVDTTVSGISSQSVRNVALFLEVFEICTQSPDGSLALKEEKKWLLKAAFKPLKKVIELESDAIPF
jgi:hypothetical protein